MSLKEISKTKDKRLKRCPYCGEEAVYVKFVNNKIFSKITAYIIECSGCKIRTSIDFNKENLKAKWNKRVKEENIKEDKNNAYINFL